jgi:hypothetical protein
MRDKGELSEQDPLQRSTYIYKIVAGEPALQACNLFKNIISVGDRDDEGSERQKAGW